MADKLKTYEVSLENPEILSRRRFMKQAVIFSAMIGTVLAIPALRQFTGEEKAPSDVVPLEEIMKNPWKYNGKTLVTKGYIQQERTDKHSFASDEELYLEFHMKPEEQYAPRDEFGFLEEEKSINARHVVVQQLLPNTEENRLKLYEKKEGLLQAQGMFVIIQGWMGIDTPTLILEETRSFEPRNEANP
jgi:hypothetical protein